MHAITGLIQRPFVLPIVANTTSVPFLSPFLFSLSRRHLSSPRHDIQAISTSLSRFSPVRCAHPRDTRALARKYRRTQEAIKSRNVFAWGRHVGRGESATTAVSSNGSFRARRRPPIGKELIAIIVLPILPLCVYCLARVALCQWDRFISSSNSFNSSLCVLLTQGKIQISRVTDKIYLAHFSTCILLSFACLNKRNKVEKKFFSIVIYLK